MFMVAILDEPVYWVIDRYRKIELKIMDSNPLNTLCSDLVLLDTVRFKSLSKTFNQNLALARS